MRREGEDAQQGGGFKGERKETDKGKDTHTPRRNCGQGEMAADLLCARFKSVGKEPTYLQQGGV